LKFSPWNAISSILGDDYTNSEDYKVHETQDLMIIIMQVQGN
jgi:hypothetical protein